MHSLIRLKNLKFSQSYCNMTLLFRNKELENGHKPTKVDFSQERKWLCTKISTTRISHAFPASVIYFSGYRNIEKSRFHPTCQNYVEIGPSRSFKSGREIRVVEIFVHNHRLSCEKSTLIKSNRQYSKVTNSY